MLGKEYSEDIEYLEKEHGKVLGFISQLEHEDDYASKVKICRSLLDTLLEHNGFEESFIYDNYNDLDFKMIEGVQVESDWKCKFC